MIIEEAVKAALNSLVDNRVYPDVVPAAPTFPCITFQGVGGNASWYADQTVPDTENNRLQINTHALTRAEANQLARRVERVIAASFAASKPYGRFIPTYDDVAKIYGTRQDFGIQFAVSL